MTQGLGDFACGIAVTGLESGKKDTLAMSAERGSEYRADRRVEEIWVITELAYR